MTLREATDGLPKSVQRWLALFFFAACFGIFVALAYADGTAEMKKNSDDIADLQTDMAKIEDALTAMTNEIGEMKISQAVLLAQLESLNKQLVLLMETNR